MHPHGAGYPYWHWQRRPSRFLWFCFGAAAASLWMKHKEHSQNGRFYGHCIRAPIQPPNAEASSSSWSPRDISRAINNIPPDTHMLHESNALDEEKERLREIGQKAGDKLADLSEATLETVLTTVEVLKAKLAEHRAERQKLSEEESKRRSLDRSV